MDPKPFVLDTSALFSLLEEEAGADRVERILRKEKVYLPWVTLLEVHYISQQERGEDIANFRLALLKKLSAEIVWQHDEPALLLASGFKAQHRLSLADALIAGIARRLNAVLVHKDPELEALNGAVDLEALPYKGSKAAIEPPR
ncbi:MAG TPA: PIN domain-containing protein [Thermoanaerobaculia bacterium]|nr:PIN domain-containing protein [Thermoanaerobaculia bacterium]